MINRYWKLNSNKKKFLFLFIFKILKGYKVCA